MMTVERFEVTIELMPLIQGEIRVVSMNLQKPKVRVSADENGIVDWLRRETPAKPLDPSRVSLAGVQISDGEVSYADARTGIKRKFEGVTAEVEAGSLAGPWRATGKYVEAGKEVPFDLATGLRLDDGTIRVKAGYTPPQWPVTVSADGVLASDPQTGLSYTGTYAIAEVVAPPEPNQPDTGAPPGWKSEGTFALTHERVVIDKAVLSIGPSSVAGSLTLNFGAEPRFEAAVEARQLDLDGSLGGGPSAPVNVSELAQGFVERLATLPVPAIPGRIAFNVPAIVSVARWFRTSVHGRAGRRGLEGGRVPARLPGQTSVSADGVLIIDRQVGFIGSARLCGRAALSLRLVVAGREVGLRAQGCWPSTSPEKRRSLPAGFPSTRSMRGSAMRRSADNSRGKNRARQPTQAGYST